MADQIKGWAKGKHLTAVTVVGFTEGADNILTAASTASLSGIVDYFRFRSDPHHEMITSVDDTQANYEITLEDSEVQLGEILRNKVIGVVSQLPTFMSLYDRFRITCIRAGQTYAFWTTRGSFSDGITSFGKNTCEATFRPFDPGTSAAVVYTA